MLCQTPKSYVKLKFTGSLEPQILDFLQGWPQQYLAVAQAIVPHICQGRRVRSQPPGSWRLWPSSARSLSVALLLCCPVASRCARLPSSPINAQCAHLPAGRDSADCERLALYLKVGLQQHGFIKLVPSDGAPRGQVALNWRIFRSLQPSPAPRLAAGSSVGGTACSCTSMAAWSASFWSLPGSEH